MNAPCLKKLQCQIPFQVESQQGRRFQALSDKVSSYTDNLTNWREIMTWGSNFPHAFMWEECACSNQLRIRFWEDRGTTSPLHHLWLQLAPSPPCKTGTYSGPWDWELRKRSLPYAHCCWSSSELCLCLSGCRCEPWECLGGPRSWGFFWAGSGPPWNQQCGLWRKKRS